MVKGKTYGEIATEAGRLVAWLVFLVLWLQSTAQAAAPGYDVQICSPQGNVRGRGLQLAEEDRATNFVLRACESLNSEPTISIATVSGLVSGFGEWSVNAAPGTLVSSVQGDRTVRRIGADISRSLKFAALPDDVLAPEAEHFFLFDPPANGSFIWTPASPTPVMHSRVVCRAALGCDNEGREEQILFTNVTAHVVDLSDPTISTSGELLDIGPLRGSKEVSFRASDLGAGVFQVFLLVDGLVAQSRTDANSGFCVRPFQAMAPCKGTLDSSFTVNTRDLADGPHGIAVVVEDASGRTASSAANIDVHNRPTNTGPPPLSGVPEVGQSLTAGTGQWDGNPTKFAYRWLRCPAGVSAGQAASCAPVAGADGKSYQAAQADAGMRLIVRVTAINFAGLETALSAPSDLVATVGGNSGGGKSPQTMIVRHPRKRTASRTARFAFTSDESGSRFECKLDKGAFRRCRASLKRKVRPARHTLRVRAVNESGTADPTPAKFGWRVLRRSAAQSCRKPTSC